MTAKQLFLVGQARLLRSIVDVESTCAGLGRKPHDLRHRRARRSSLVISPTGPRRATIDNPFATFAVLFRHHFDAGKTPHPAAFPPASL
jgi:hypothetical protein